MENTERKTESKNEHAEAAAPKFYKIEVTQLKPVDKETSERPEGRDVLFKAYAHTGELPEDYVDLGKYWECGDGYVCICTKDGEELMCLRSAMDCVGEHMAKSPMDLCDMALKLGDECSWFELSSVSGHWSELDRKLVVRIVDRPDLDWGLTKKHSDLNVMEAHRVKIYGVPLFRDGDVSSRTILRTDLRNMLNEMWKDYLKKFGVDADVVVKDVPSAEEYVTRDLCITTRSEYQMQAALRALGVFNDVIPYVKPEFKTGVGPEATRVVAHVSISEVIQ